MAFLSGALGHSKPPLHTASLPAQRTGAAHRRPLHYVGGFLTRSVFPGIAKHITFPLVSLIHLLSPRAVLWLQGPQHLRHVSSNCSGEE